MPWRLMSTMTSRDLLDDLRREAERRLVEQQELGRGHQRAADGEHLLLAAGEVAGRRPAALGEHREEVEHAVRALLHLGLRAAREGARPEVLVDRELGEDAPALHDLGDAAPDDGGRVHARDLTAGQRDAALRDLPPVDGEQTGDRAQERGLARAVGTEQRHDGAVGDFERHAAQHEDDVRVDDFHVADGQHRRRRHRRRSPGLGQPLLLSQPAPTLTRRPDPAR